MVHNNFEIHITLEPCGNKSYDEFVAVVLGTIGSWKVRKFEHDGVDGMEGKWFLTRRESTLEMAKTRARQIVRCLEFFNAQVLRFKIEQTMIDSKLGDDYETLH
jgi:hypothetical protein